MTEASNNTRIDLARKVAVFQLKLVADGLRDALLIPVSLIAGLVGLIRGGDDPEREFRRVLKIGRRSERWINLFGHEKPLGRSVTTGSMDAILEQVESAVIEQYRKGKQAEERPKQG